MSAAQLPRRRIVRAGVALVAVVASVACGSGLARTNLAPFGTTFFTRTWWAGAAEQFSTHNVYVISLPGATQAATRTLSETTGVGGSSGSGAT